MTYEERARKQEVDVEGVACPVCHAPPGWACERTHAGRYGGSHADPVHPARAKAAIQARKERTL